MDDERMTYSRRELYALGEPFGESATSHKLGGRIYGGGGGGIIGSITSAVSGLVGGVGKAAADVVHEGGNALDAVGLGGIHDALSGVNNAVKDSIPGGWTTVAEVVGASMGIPPEAVAAMGATSGSGILQGKPLNLKGAIQGGIQGYGVANLTNMAMGAPPAAPVDPSNPAGTTQFGGGPEVVDRGIGAVDAQPYSAQGPQISSTPVASVEATTPAPYNSMPPSEQAQTLPGTLADGKAPVVDLSQPAQPMQASTPQSVASQVYDSAKATAQNIGSSISNAVSGGEAAAGSSGMTLGGALKGTALAGLSLTALQALKQQQQPPSEADKLAMKEYQDNMAKIDSAIAAAQKAVANNPYRVDSADAGHSLNATGSTLYGPSGITTYAMGGSVNPNETPDTLMAGGITNSFRFDTGGTIDNASGMPMNGITSGFKHGGQIQHFDKGGMWGSNDFLIDAVKGAGVQGVDPNSPRGEIVTTSDGSSSTSKEVPSAATKAAFEKNQVPYRVDSMPNPNDLQYSNDLGITLYNNKPHKNAYAHGGGVNEPRFLSGGGDGMSDSIPANIDGHTEARLADGEFVIPADVVSHLGNGSSKAGAKQLYSMMDRIRKARTGNPKQGKQINPNKFLPS
jgi:hypothetical protein